MSARSAPGRRRQEKLWPVVKRPRRHNSCPFMLGLLTTAHGLLIRQ